MKNQTYLKVLLKCLVVLAAALVQPSKGFTQCADFDLVGPATLCSNQGSTYSYNIVGTLGCSSGIWQFSGATSIPNQTAQTIDIIWGTTPGQWVAYIDTITNYSDTIFLQPCCLEPGMQNLTDYTFNQLVMNISNIFPSQNYQLQSTGPNTYTLKLVDLTFAINGLFFIEEGNNIEFHGCNIKMGPGAQIKLQRFSLHTLKLLSSSNNNTTIAASVCGIMWRGIYLGEGTSYEAIRATIRDAQYAIRVTQKCFINSVNSNYENNFVSFYWPLISSISNNAFHSSDNLEGNLFQDPDLLPPFINQSPMSTGKTLCGIIAYNLHSNLMPGQNGLKFNTSPSSQNTFINLNCGIAVYNSYADVYNCEFRNMDYVPGYSSYPFSGYSIASVTDGSINPNYSPTINIGGMNSSTVSKNVLIGSRHSGIYLNGNSANSIVNCEINAIDYGINQSFNKVGSSTIIENTINNVQFGIMIQELSNDFNSLNISNNRIARSLYGYSEGISVYNSIPFKIKTDINENKLYEYSKGITLFNMYAGKNFNLNLNEVNLSSSDFSSGLHTGIHLSNVKGMLCEGNLVSCTGTDPNQLSSYSNDLNGFLMENTFESKLYSNRVETFGTGIKLAYDCRNTFFHCNYLMECYPSFRFHEVYLSDQISSCFPNYTSFETNFDPTYLRFVGNILNSPIDWFYDAGSILQDPSPFDPSLIIKVAASRECIPVNPCSSSDPVEEKINQLSQLQAGTLPFTSTQIFDGKVHVKSDSKDIIKVEIFDNLGRSIQTFNANGKNVAFTLSKVLNGIYYVRVTTSDLLTESTMFAIQN